MVQVAEHAQWRFADESNGVEDASAANRRNVPLAPQKSAPEKLKWYPGTTSAEAKGRAKELRKAVEQRGERRDAMRHYKSVLSTSASEDARSCAGQPQDVDDSADGSSRCKLSASKPTMRVQKASMILSQVLWREDADDADIAVWLLKPGGASSLCRQWVRSGACRFGANCRHSHDITLAPHAELACSRGAAMPSIERTDDPRSLNPDAVQRIAFIISGSGRVCYDYEDPSAATAFLYAENNGGDCSSRGVGVGNGFGDDGCASPFPQLSDDLWSNILAETNASGLRAAACASAALNSLVARDCLWLRMYRRTFGRLEQHAAAAEIVSGGTTTLSASGAVEDEPGAVTVRHARSRCVASDRHLSSWRQSVESEPSALPLPAMTSACLSGSVGMSTHEGRLTRLWEASTGRRLACHQHKARQTLTCCDAAAGCAAVGDLGGGVLMFGLDDGLEPHQHTVCADAENGSARVTPISCVRLLCATDDSHSVRHGAGHEAASGPLLAIGTAAGRVYVHATSRASPERPRMLASVGIGGSGYGGASYCGGVHLDGYMNRGIAVRASDELCLLDLETGRRTWNVDSFSEDGADAPAVVQPWTAAMVGRRPVSYSPGWWLVGAITADGCGATLWDPRVDARRMGPAARITLPIGQNGELRERGGSGDGGGGGPALPIAWSIHLDEGSGGGGGWPGHALVSSNGGAVYIFDIRCVGGVKGGGSSALECLAKVAVPREGRLGGGAGGGIGGAACFVADAHRLVASGGVKSPSAFMWTMKGSARHCGGEARGDGSSKGGGQRESLSLREEDLDVSDPPELSRTPRTKKGKARQTKKQWSH